MSLIKAARGDIPVDLLVTNVQLANVLTGEVYPAEIAVHEDTIVAVERPGDFPPREAHQRLDGAGQLAAPGLVDSHVHIESSLVTPASFAEAALRCGTTTVAADPHEIANATGLEGVRHFVNAGRGLPMGIFFLASTCVPAAAGLEHCRGELGADEIAEMLSWDDVIGLAEVMDARAVVDDEARLRDILTVGKEYGGVIEGHNPMLRGRDLMAYVTAGVDSDHTLVPADVYVEKLRLGVTVQLQERYVSEAVIETIAALPQPLPTLCLVTDDVAPDHFEEAGHLDHVLRHAMRCGLPPMQALQAATINPARRLRLYDRDGIAVAEGHSLVAMTPLPIAGVVSDAPLSAVAGQMRHVRAALAERGLEHPYLLMRLSTFTLPVSSGLRITDVGYVLAEERRHVPA